MSISRDKLERLRYGISAGERRDLR